MFCSDAIQPHTSVYSVFCAVNNYTAHATKQRTGLYNGVSCDYASSTAHDTRPTQAVIIPPATRWRVYTHPDALNRYQIPPPRRDAAQVNTAAYYNKVYKRVQGCACYGSMPDSAAYRRPCQRRRSVDAFHARRLKIWHPPPGGAVQRQGRGRRRGTIGGFRRISFRAFAR